MFPRLLLDNLSLDDNYLLDVLLTPGITFLRKLYFKSNKEKSV